MENKEGIIQRIKSDRKALAIENVWYNSYKPLVDSIQVGNEVKLVYSVKGDFKNIKSVELIKNETMELPKEKIVQCYDFKPNQIMTRENLNNGKLLPKEIPNQTENTILMCVKDLICQDIQMDINYTPEELTSKISKLSLDFKKAYNKL